MTKYAHHLSATRGVIKNMVVVQCADCTMTLEHQGAKRELELLLVGMGWAAFGKRGWICQTCAASVRDGHGGRSCVLCPYPLGHAANAIPHGTGVAHRKCIERFKSAAAKRRLREANV